jgi:hypothetical protein
LVSLSKDITKWSTGVVTHYALYILIGFFIILGIGNLNLNGGYSISLFLLLLISCLSTLNLDNLNKISTSLRKG